MFSDEDLAAYTLRLYGRRAEGILTRQARARIGDWEPIEHECHANVTAWCERNRDHKPVRGWLYFDFENNWILGVRPYVRFNTHAVVENEHGELVDITPTRSSTQYSFIRAEDSEAEYDKVIEALNARSVH